MAYTSQINLGIGQEPQSKNNDLYPDLLDIYNALHILSQYTDLLIKNQTSGDASKKPWESMPFRNWFYEIVAEDVVVGNIITPLKTGAPLFTGSRAFDSLSGQYYKGAPATFLDNGVHTTWGNGFIGFVLEDTKAGNLCKIGVGPAIVNIPGCREGEVLWAKSIYNGQVSFDLPPDGLIYRFPGPYMVAIGACISDDAAMIFPYPDFWSGNANAYKYTQGSTGGDGL